MMKQKLVFIFFFINWVSLIARRSTIKTLRSTEVLCDSFGYFDTQKTDWEKVKATYQPLIDTVTTDRSFVELLQIGNNELYNGHISLNTNLPSSSRLIPTGADLWVEYQNKQFVIPP
jgi:hypothetical protein